jgi:GNAT superfamily N-acetyltransferase
MSNLRQITVSIKDKASCLCTFYNNGKANVMIIDSVEVEEEERGHGIGTKLIEQALELARKQDVDSVELNVNKDNIPAKKLYEKIGFKKTNKDYYRKLL